MNNSIVYADLTFLINLIMDFAILWAAGKLARIRMSLIRLMFAAVIGGIYAVGYLFPEMAGFYSLPMKLVFSALIVVLGLYPRGFKEFKKAFLYFYAISFIVAGATIASSYLFSDQYSTFSFSYLWLLGGLFCALLIGSYAANYLTKNLIPGLLSYKVRIKFAESSCEGEGFLDTGNSLKDPLTNKPVIVAEYDFIKSCLPGDLCQVMNKPSNEGEMIEKLSSSSWANRLRLIPFSSIGKKNGLLVGVRADEIIIDHGNTPMLQKNVIIGIYLDKLSGENSYQMLIPAEIIQSS